MPSSDVFTWNREKEGNQCGKPSSSERHPLLDRSREQSPKPLVVPGRVHGEVCSRIVHCLRGGLMVVTDRDKALHRLCEVLGTLSRLLRVIIELLRLAQ